MSSKGLLYTWAMATAAMFILYVIFNIGMFVLGPIDTAAQDIMSSGVVSSSWVDFYYTWIPRLRDFFGYLTAASFFSLIIYVIVNSARREEDEYPVY